MKGVPSNELCRPLRGGAAGLASLWIVAPLVFVCLLSPATAWAWDVELHGMTTLPASPTEGEPFGVIVELAYNGCQPSIHTVDVVGLRLVLEGSVGPPVAGGCGGAVVYDHSLPVPVRGLAAGEYQVEVTILRIRDGGVADSIQSTVQVRGAPEVPALTPFGVTLLLGAMAWLGVRRIAA